MFNKSAFLAAAITAVSTVTLVSNAESAHAMNFKVTRGIDAGLTTWNAQTNRWESQGMFSEFHGQAGVVTVDFNKLPNNNAGFGVQAKTDANGVGLITGLNAANAVINYSYVGNGSSNVRKDQWGPAGYDATTGQSTYNTSNYLAAFAGKDVEIRMNGLFNYFGVNWGAAHQANRYSFYRGDTLVAGFTYGENYKVGDIQYVDVSKVFRENGARASWQGQDNAYFHVYADSKASLFDRIVISQFGGGGFESDNHSFNAGTRAFNFEKGRTVPEPGMVLGLIGVGAAFLHKRKKGENAI